MDGRSNEPDAAFSATLVRQYSPSRIERDLLSQVFELLCGRDGHSNDGASPERVASQAERVVAQERDFGAPVAARRAA